MRSQAANPKEPVEPSQISRRKFLLSAPLKRIRAASTLGATGDPAHVDVLIRTLADPHREARVAAIEALAKIGDRRAIGPLAQAMRDPDVSVVHQASEALERFGEAADGFQLQRPHLSKHTTAPPGGQR
jgi:HEAT repeat protein